MALRRSSGSRRAASAVDSARAQNNTVTRRPPAAAPASGAAGDSCIGDATRPEAGYSPEGFAADVATLLKARGMVRAVVVGHSMGSQAALRLAMDHPARVLGLVLIGGFPTLRGNPAADAFWDDVVRTL